MLIEKLKKYNIILGSASPRRKQLLAECGIEFSVKTTNKKEIYPPKLKGKKIAEFLARQKASIISKKLSTNDLLITADTIVMKNNHVLHKPKNKSDAKRILQRISAGTHKVISGVCIKTYSKEIVLSSLTEVTFKQLSDDEINYYIKKFKPFDKSGSYGIQEWIGCIGIEKINGSYNNVVGLPTSQLYQKLKLFI
jgi:septum formation protein